MDDRDDEDTLDETGRGERRSLFVEHSKHLFKQEALYFQKARQKWLQQGDLNTKYFHSSVAWRRVRNNFNGMPIDGQWCEDKDVVKDKVRDFFKKRFEDVFGPQVRPDNVCFNSISESDNEMLVGPFSEEEVKNAIWSCDSSTSPGLDGLNFSFIKHNWEVIKKDILLAVEDFACSGSWSRGSNASFICLIPKSDNSRSLGDFKPISLVGYLYKIVSKLLSLRLKKVLSEIIDSRQSTFLEGRGLLDNVLVANEVLEEAKRAKKSCIFFKVDYEKAYDLVKWEFIYYMLGRLGFCDKWIPWIRSCLESASKSVLVNGSPTKEFSPSKGLRQGDPLAPFLFLIVAEGLAGVSRNAESLGMIDSLEVGGKKVRVNMLQYADDTLFFCHVNSKSVFNVKAMLNCFELASGLKVNFLKSRIGGVGSMRFLFGVLQQFLIVIL